MKRPTNFIPKIYQSPANYDYAELWSINFCVPFKGLFVYAAKHNKNWVT